MHTRKAEARWNGNLKDGNGTFRVGSGAFEGSYSFGTRFEEVPGTNPEELIGAAHAGCFSMAFSATLGKAGYHPEHVETVARVILEPKEAGFTITRIELTMKAAVPNIEESEFQRLAEEAKVGCPVSRALKAVQIELKASLLK